MTAGSGMHAVGHELLRQIGVDRFRLLQRRYDRRIEVSQSEILPRREIPQELAVAHEYGIVASGKSRRTRDVVVRRGLDGGDPDMWKSALDVFNDRFEPAAVPLEDVRIERAVAAIIHAEHDCQDGRIIWDDIALQTNINWAARA